MLRLYSGDQSYKTETLATADDFGDADGVVLLDWKQAQTLARKRMVDYAHSEAGVAKPLNVADAMVTYLEYLETKTKSGREGRYAAEAFILPAFGNIEVAKLTKEQIERWHADVAKAPARIRTKAGRRQRFKSQTHPESDRRRKSTANRILTTLKAALNMAWRDGKVPSDAAWRRVTPFESVDTARIRYLSMDEIQRLLEACSPTLQALVRVALETGCRYGELIALRVEDFNADSGTLHIRESKSGKPRHVVLTPEGAAYIGQIAKDRSPADTLLVKENGAPWQRDHQKDPLKNACKTAKIEPAINFHALRHSWASHAVMRGVSLQIVARQLGHTTTRITEQHYAHLAPSFVADAIRANAPRFS